MRWREGHAVVALAGDDVPERSGGTYEVGDLAREYGFTDSDGSRPEPFDRDTGPLRAGPDVRRSRRRRS